MPLVTACTNLGCISCVVPKKTFSRRVRATLGQTNQRGEISAKSDWTVGRLKEELEKKFPGKIPASLQRLFKGTLLLPSPMTLEEASEVLFNAAAGGNLVFFSLFFFPPEQLSL